MASATAVLAIVAVFATKANKKYFTAVSTAYIGGSSSSWYLAGASSLLTTRFSLPQVQVQIFYTNGSSVLNKVTTGTGSALTSAATGNHNALYNPRF